MSVTTSQITMADEQAGTLAVQTSKGNGIDIKNVHKDGEEKSVIEGYVATTHIDQTNDQFTREALQNMAEQIRNDANATVDAVFPEIEGMEESQIGNINHNNNPAAERMMGVGDTRTVPVFKTMHAEVRTLPDGESGLHIRGEMMPLPDNVEDAVKGQIREGGLHSFSIEFKPTNVNFEVGPDGEPKRTILDAKTNGSALTGRPMNEMAEVTDAELKNILGGKTMTDKESETEEVSDEPEEVKNEEPEEVEDVPEDEEDQESEEDVEEAEGEVKNEGEGDEEEAEDESEPEEGEGDSDASDSVELKNDVKELKSMFKDIKEENEKLKEENDELKSKLDDFKTIKDIKSEITELKSAVEASDEDLEGDRPEPEEDQDREFKSGSEDKEQWKKVVDQLGMDEDDLKSEIGSRGMTEAESIAETHGVKEEEVIEYAK